MKYKDKISRREILGAGVAGAAVLGLGRPALAKDPPARGKGRIRQSVCRWCYSRIPLEKLTREAARLGYRSIELLDAKEVKIVKAQGLTCAIMRCASIADGLNRTENHARIEKELRDNIDFAAAEGIPNVICMSGNRRGMSDKEGLANCVRGLKRILGHAERRKITVCMEGLNSKVDHKDYMYDHTPWGVELCRKIDSPRFKLLYDIYHMQIMEGDVIRTIRQYKDYIGHYHTGGNPGRHEIDDTQELNYPAIVRAIIETGYTGYLGQEFIPVRDPLKSLAQAFQICDV